MTEEQILQLVEEKMNVWANSILDKYRRIKPNSFRIIVKQNKEAVKPTDYGYIVQDGSHHNWMVDDRNAFVRPKRTYIVKPNELLDSHSSLLATVVNGSTVQITLYVPLMRPGDSLKEHLNNTIKKMKSTCKGLLKYLNDPRLHNDDELFNPTIVGDTLHEYILGANATKVWRRRKYNVQEMNGLNKSEFSFSLERKLTVKHKETGIEVAVLSYDNSKTQWELEQEAWDKCSELVNEHLKSQELKYRSMSKSLVPFGHYHTLIHPIWD